MIQLDYRDVRPIYAQIADAVREQVVSGVLQSGDRLDSVRELATVLAINPNTIQRAYRELEMQGWIATVPGKGCFVSGIPLGALSEQEKLMRELRRQIEKLLAMGVSKQAILEIVEQEGSKDA